MKLFNRAQKETETVQDYVAHMRQQAESAQLPQGQTLQANLHGLNGSARPFNLQQNPRTLNELMRVGKMEDISTAVPRKDTVNQSLAEIKQQIDTLTICSLRSCELTQK